MSSAAASSDIFGAAGAATQSHFTLNARPAVGHNMSVLLNLLLVKHDALCTSLTHFVSERIEMKQQLCGGHKVTYLQTPAAR